MGVRDRPRVAAVLAVGVGLWLIAPAIAARATVLSLDPPVVAVDASTVVTGTGFGVSEAVDVFLDDVSVGMRLSSPKGALDAVRVPIGTDEAPGIHWVTAVGRRSGLEAQVEVTVVGTSVWGHRSVDAAKSGWNPDERAIDPGTVDTLQPVWSAELAAHGNVSNVLIAGGTVLVVGTRYPAEDDYENETSYAAALDATDGHVVWDREIGSSWRAATDGVRLYVGSQDEWRKGATTLGARVSALDVRTGDTLWTHELPAGERPRGYVTNSVQGIVVDDDVVIVSSVASHTGSGERTYVTAIDADDGGGRWQASIDAWSEAVVVGNGTVVVAAGDHLVALDGTDGSTRWSSWTGEGTYQASIVGGLVFAQVRDRGEEHVEMGTALTARRVADGRVLWRAPWDSWLHGFAVTGDTVIATGGMWESSSGDLVALDTATGERRWDGFGVDLQPSGAGRLFYSAAMCGITARDPATGEAVGQIPDVRSPFLVANGRVVATVCGGWDEMGTIRAFAPAPAPAPEPSTLEPDPMLAPDRRLSAHEAFRAGWTDVVWEGLATGDVDVTAIAAFEGALYLGTRDERDGGGLFRSADDGATFARVGERGFGDTRNVALTPVAFGDELVVLTENARGLEVWTSSDGGVFERKVSGGLGDPANVAAVPYPIDDRLVLGVENARAGAQAFVLREGSTEVEKVLGLPTSGITSFVSGHVELEGSTYVGTAGSAPVLLRWTEDGSFARVLRARGADAVTPRAVFGGALFATARDPEGLDVLRVAATGQVERVVEGGFRSPQDADVDGSLAVFDDALYLATSSLDPRREPGPRPVEVAPERGFGLWRSVDGTSWEQVGERGFGDPHAIGADLMVAGDRLLLVAADFEEGDTIHASGDGATWDPILAEDSSSHGSLGFTPLLAGRYLLAVHGDVTTGLTTLRLDEPVLGAAAAGWWGWPAALTGLGLLLVVAIAGFAVVHARHGRHEGPSPHPV